MLRIKMLGCPCCHKPPVLPGAQAEGVWPAAQVTEPRRDPHTRDLRFVRTSGDEGREDRKGPWSLVDVGFSPASVPY